MTTVAVVTALYGAYDPLKDQPPQDMAADWICVTDNPEVSADPWRIVHEPRPHMHPRLAAKVPKCRPDLYTDADVIIWLDASFLATEEWFVRWCVDQLGAADIAQIRHPHRDNITLEASASIRLDKYRGQMCRQQVDHYLAAGNVRPGLWCTGFAVRRNTPEVAAFGDRWLLEQVRWTYQDQLSQTACLGDLVTADLATSLTAGSPVRLFAHNRDD